MSWDTEFPSQYTPAPEILKLVTEGWAEDLSWHHDAAPSFGIMFPDETTIRIWSHPERPEDREVPEWVRFVVTIYNFAAGVDKAYIQTNDVAKAIDIYMKAITPFLLHWPSPKGWSPRGLPEKPRFDR